MIEILIWFGIVALVLWLFRRELKLDKLYNYIQIKNQESIDKHKELQELQAKKEGAKSDNKVGIFSVIFVLLAGVYIYQSTFSSSEPKKQSISEPIKSENKKSFDKSTLILTKDDLSNFTVDFGILKCYEINVNKFTNKYVYLDVGGDMYALNGSARGIIGQAPMYFKDINEILKPKYSSNLMSNLIDRGLKDCSE